MTTSYSPLSSQRQGRHGAGQGQTDIETLDSSPGSRMTASHSAGSGHFWLGLLPIFPGLGNRGQTHRVSSHSRSTGRAGAPQVSAAAKLQHRCPPSHPLSVGLGQHGQRDNWDRPGSPLLSAWEKENMGVRLSPPLSLAVSSRPARLQGQGWLN